MAYAVDVEASTWTALDLVRRFGAIPLSRIRHDPPPGTATEQDVIDIHDREGRLFELVEGILVEKTVGAFESYLAVLLAGLLGNHVRDHRLGIVLGPDGMTRLSPGLVRIPDVSFVSWARLHRPENLKVAILPVAPDVAVEVISKGNTRREMKRKLEEYFAAAVRRVWYIYPAKKQVHVYSAADQATVLGEPDMLEDSELLPGFVLSLREYFAEPSPPETGHGRLDGG